MDVVIMYKEILLQQLLMLTKILIMDLLWLPIIIIFLKVSLVNII